MPLAQGHAWGSVHRCMVSRINASCLVSLLLTACGAGEADEAPEFTPSQAGSAGSAGQTSSAGSAGAAGTTQLANAGTGGTGGTTSVTEASDECNFRGPYRLIVVVTGGSECSGSTEFDNAGLQGRDVDACTGTFCVGTPGGGQHCLTLDCDRGNPVPECSMVETTDDGCTKEWTMVPG